MEIVMGAKSTLLPKLANLLREEYKLQKSVKGEIMFLQAELESMQTALLRISKAPIDQPLDIQVNLWARDVREPRAPNKPCGLGGFVNRSSILMKNTNIRRKICIDIKDIKSKIMEVSQRRGRYKVDNVVDKPLATVHSLRQSALYKDVTSLVGTKDKSDALVRKLMEADVASKNQQRILSIVGFGGLGKITLAKMIYDKLKVQYHRRAFVSISLNPDMEKILKSMLYQLDMIEYSNINEATWDEVHLIGQLRELLQNKKSPKGYLIVIDDIWEKNVWERIKYVLVENDAGSVIITTSRILDLAQQVGGVYQIEPLSFPDSKMLFYQRIFGSEDKAPPHLAKVSEKILKKCGGVPLAIITISGLLASKRDKENIKNYWSTYNLMGSGLDDNPDVSDMRRILSISYYDLSPHLRTCLLYLSLYPEDYEIDRDDLVWKWVGECFIQNEMDNSLLELGEDYFDELVNKILVQPTSFDIHGRATHCRVHDMVLDLINSMSNEENFLTIIGGPQNLSLPNKIHRLSLQCSREQDVKQLSTMSLSHVRSLIVSKLVFVLLPALPSFPVLRVLDLSDCYQVDDQHFKYICNLFLLRYLNLCATGVKVIPKEIGNLLFLKALNIDMTSIEEVPSTFLQLRQLTCLHLPKTLMRLPDGFGALPVEEFMRIKSLAILNLQAGFTKLRRLYVHFTNCEENYAKAFSMFLSDLVSLEILEVSGSSMVSLDSGCDNLSPRPQRLWSIDMSDCRRGSYDVPRWMPSLSSLTHLCIHIFVVSEMDLRVLSNIPALRWLKLGVDHGMEGLVVDSSYTFRCLKWLEIDCAEMLRFAPGAMRKLKTLYVPNPCARWPVYGVENLPLLEHLSFSICCKLEELDGVKAEYRELLNTYPNKPTFEMHQVYVLFTKFHDAPVSELSGTGQRP